MPLFGLFIDPTYLMFLIPGLLLAMFASFKVKANFAKYSKVRVSTGLTGAQAAREMLRRNGIHDVSIEETQGMLSDHYDPRTKTVRLSPKVYRQPSIASVAVATHEVGHALQHAKKYAPLALRSAAVPMARIGSWAPWIIMIGGFMLHMTSAVYLGVILFAGVVLFQLITLPVEFNASSRANEQVMALGLIGPQDQKGMKKVLSAAAMTYVAAAVTAALQLLYYVSLITGGSRD